MRISDFLFLLLKQNIDLPDDKKDIEEFDLFYNHILIDIKKDDDIITFYLDSYLDENKDILVFAKYLKHKDDIYDNIEFLLTESQNIKYKQWLLEMNPSDFRSWIRHRTENCKYEPRGIKDYYIELLTNTAAYEKWLEDHTGTYGDFIDYLVSNNVITKSFREYHRLKLIDNNDKYDIEYLLSKKRTIRYMVLNNEGFDNFDIDVDIDYDTYYDLNRFKKDPSVYVDGLEIEYWYIEL